MEMTCFCPQYYFSSQKVGQLNHGWQLLSFFIARWPDFRLYEGSDLKTSVDEMVGA